jgi:hypothetical protein
MEAIAETKVYHATVALEIVFNLEAGSETEAMDFATMYWEDELGYSRVSSVEIEEI